MKLLLTLLSVLILVSAVSADRLVRVSDITTGAVQQLLADGYDVANVNIMLGYVDLMIPEQEVDQLSLRFADYELLPREWGELLPVNAKNAGYYYSPEENWLFWCELAANYTDLADTPVTIGQSYQSRDIYMIKMTSPVGSGYKPPIYFSSLIHGREPGSNVVLIDFAEWLASNYDGGDTRAAWILDNTIVYFVPVANPDAYVYNMPNGGNQRKNMNWVGSNGIDLNRNWGYMWGYDNIGSSGDPYAQTYRGLSAFSEKETQVQRDFITDIQPIAAMNYHTYGGYLLYPWGYINSPTPDQSTFQTWSAAMTSSNNYQYGRAGEILYTVNGEQNDWCYGGNSMQSILAFTPEVGDNGFWGSQNDPDEIERICDECRPMNIWLCMNAPGYVGVGEDEGVEIEPVLSLSAVYPNPVVSSAVFTLTAPGSTGVKVTVYDTSGRVVDNITGEFLSGENTLIWNVTDDIAAGVYILRVTDSNGFAASRRFTVLK